MRNNCFLVRHSSWKAFHPGFSVTLWWAHCSSWQSEQPGVQSCATSMHVLGKPRSPLFVLNLLLLISFNIPRSFSRHTSEGSLLSTFSFCTSEMPNVCSSLLLIQERVYFYIHLIFSASQCLGKRVILMTQPQTVHTQTYAFAHTLQKGNVHFQVHSPPPHTILAVGLCSSSLRQT